MKLQFRNAASPVRLTVAIGGDFCPGQHGSEIASAGRAGEVLAPLATFLADADLRLVQFETPLVTEESPIPKTGPSLASSPESAEIIKGVFDVALLANNHVGDHGPGAVLATIRELRARGIDTVGAGANLAEAVRPLEIERNGVSVSVFNFAEFEFGVAEDGVPGVAPQRVGDDLAAVARSAACGRLPIVVLHGGHEHFPFPSPRIRDLCRAFADAGAKFVVNCHPHCPQGMEWHCGVPVVYCPGNLWFPRGMPSSADRPFLWGYGYVAKVRFDDIGPFALELLPYESGQDYVSPLNSDARDACLEYISHISEPLSDPARLQSLFDAWSAERGRFYLRMSAAALPEEFFGERGCNGWERPIKDPRPFLEMRNIFTCESHHDIVRRFLRLAVEGRIPDAMHPCAEIAALQNPKFALPPGLPPLRPRTEMLDFLERNVFGRVPASALNPALRFEEIEPEAPAMGGVAIRRRVRVSYAGPGGEGHFDILAFIPAGATPQNPASAALLLCNRDPSENMDPERARRTPFWDAERIVGRGWAALAFHTGSVTPDNADGFDRHLQSLFLASGEAGAPDAWGTLAAWAWCGSRVMDWIGAEPRINARRVMVAGHSRGGKAALWCAARDERFFMVASSCSGCGGAKLNRARLPASESIAQLVDSFPHWFCRDFARFAGHDMELPFDQHWLLALVAPRRLYVTSATLDPWAGQAGESLAVEFASPAWPNRSHVAYHIRQGVHTIESSDWDRWLDFAER